MEKVTGIITNLSSSPLEGVSVVVDESGLTATDGGATAVTNAQGEFTLENISIGTHIITFKKDNYKTASVTVVANKFNDEGIAHLSAVLEYRRCRNSWYGYKCFSGEMCRWLV